MRNEGNIDRVLRGIVAVVAVIVALVVGGGWGVVFWIVAAIMALTAVLGMCPIYKVLGISTQPKAS